MTEGKIFKEYVKEIPEWAIGIANKEGYPWKEKTKRGVENVTETAFVSHWNSIR